MRQKKLWQGLKTGALALCLAAAIPFSANAATKLDPEGKGLDESQMTEEEKKGYELTKEYTKTLPKIDPNPHIPEEYFSVKKSKGYKDSNLESKYDSRTKGVISHVKNQDITGACWCFSFLDSAEASLRSDGVESVDFSEYQLAYFIYNQNNDKLGLSQDKVECLNGEVGSLNYYGIGATSLGDIFAATKTVGLINEDEAKVTDLMEKLHEEGKATLPEDYCYNHNAYTVSGAKLFITSKQKDDIKKCIKEYGAGQITYFHHPDCYDYSTYAFYHAPEIPYNKGGGHAVTVVGWDDNYSKDNFAYSPKNDGAWLVKNSWDETWGNDGYFWMSYEEPSLGYAVFVDMEKADEYDNIYQYDGSVATDFVYNYLSEANVFTAQNDELLGSVSFFTVKDDTKYEVSIYKNPEEGKPNSGELLEKLEGTIEHMGYTKLDLKKAYNLDKGDRFSVVVKQTVNGSPTDFYIDKYSNDDFYVNFCVSHEGESYLSKDGNEWEDVSAEGDRNLRIKAFTKINESASGEELSFEKTDYEVKIDEDVATVVKLDDNVASGKAKLEFSIEDENIATVDSRGVVAGKIAGETKLTVKYKDKTATATIKVVPDKSVTSIDINKKNDYATEKNPLEVSVGSVVSLSYTVSPKSYKSKVHATVELIEGDFELDDFLMTLGAGQYLFRHDGLYKVTISIEDQEGLKGSSQEFFIKVGYNSVDCGSDYTKIAENPYKDDELKIYRYSNPSYKSNLVTFDGSLEQDADYLGVLGFDDDDVTDQDLFKAIGIYPGYPENIEVINELTGDITDKQVKVPYKNVAFILISDEAINDSFKVKSIEGYNAIEQISMKKEDLVINAKVGEKVEKEFSLLPEGCDINDVVINYEENGIVDVGIEGGKLVIDPKKIGSTDIILLNSSEGFDSENIEEGYEESNGVISAKVIKLTVNVTSDQELPDSLAFVDDEDKEISNISIERNATQKLKLNSSAWDGYTVSYSSSDNTIALVDDSGEITAISTGPVKITAVVSVPGKDEEEPKEYKAEIKVNVIKPDIHDINNLQTLHNYVRGMDELYTYSDSNADTECMNLYFDARTAFDEEDYITIQDGNGYFYGIENGKIITKWAESDTKLSDSFRFNGNYNRVPSVLTIYDETVNVHLVSKAGTREYEMDESESNAGPGPMGFAGASESEGKMIYGDSYGFSIKRIETGAAAKEIKVEDVAVDFSTYKSFEKRVKVTKVPENAIDKVYYQIEDESIANVEDGIVTGKHEGETECRAYTVNPEVNIEGFGKVTVGGKKFTGVEFYKECDASTGALSDQLNNPDTIEMIVGEWKILYFKNVPWNSPQDITYEVSDENGLSVNIDAYIEKLKYNMMLLDAKVAGEYTVNVYVPGNDEPIQVINVIATEPGIPEEFETFKAESFATDGNDGIAPTEITEGEIRHINYEDGESIYWTYKRDGADYVDITFSKNGSIETKKDWIYIYDLDGKLIGRYTGDKNNSDEETCFAGKTIRVPGEGFILGFVSDGMQAPGESYDGFKIVDIKPHFDKKAEDSTEAPTNDDKKDNNQTKEESKKTDSNVSKNDDKKDNTQAKDNTTKTDKKSKTPKVGQNVKVGKVTYKVLSKNTVAYVKTNVKNPSSVTIPSAVKISGKKYKVTEISANAFKNKKKLKIVTIGENVKKIGKNAFSGCKSLKRINVKSKNLKSVEVNAIKGINSKAVIKVPKVKVNAYKKLFTKKTGFKKSMSISK